MPFLRLLGCCLLPLVVGCLSLGKAVDSAPRPLPEATAEKLPRWRGFNLLNKFSTEYSQGPFQEEDFQLIAQLGFNFARLPLDYRCWIVDGDPRRFNEAELKEIDQAVAWGRQYGVHVCINLHRAPGYCVGAPAEALDLWSDPKALELCVLHWQTLARRYRGVPARELSFDLVNEPPAISEAAYARVVEQLVAAIRAADPERLIIVDGRSFGNAPSPSLKPLRLAQACRGYVPFEVTHWRAPWARGSDTWPTPTWPLAVVSGVLFGDTKAALRQPMIIVGPFPAGQELRMRLQFVSGKTTLRVLADGQELWRRDFDPQPGPGEWVRADYRPQWRITQAEYDLELVVPIPAGIKKLEIAAGAGDWVRLGELAIHDAAGAVARLPLTGAWDAPGGEIQFRGGASPALRVPGREIGKEWLRSSQFARWQELERQGIGVMVGEWGVYNRTPHDVALRWMRDNLELWQEFGWGWALWNFRGDFGVLDSGRTDVMYEEWHGHKLDRQMLELLQAH